MTKSPFERKNEQLARTNAPVADLLARMKRAGVVEREDGTFYFQDFGNRPAIQLADATTPDPDPKTPSIAATLAAGIIASGRSSISATPQGAIQAYDAVLDALEKR